MRPRSPGDDAPLSWTSWTTCASACGYQPYAFVWDFHERANVTRLDGFKHRTFTYDDAYWFTTAFSMLLRRYRTVEAIFTAGHTPKATNVGAAIQGFSVRMMSALAVMPTRMWKHLARPAAGSAAKRLCMYLRWMVRPGPVDLGLWNAITPRQLVLPLDVHSGRQARQLGVLDRQSDDWRAAMELTTACRTLCPGDPARYDYAFFGLGVNGGPPDHVPLPILDA